MSRNHSQIDRDEGPHTLRSGLHSPEIAVPNYSFSDESRSLEISQSPTQALIQGTHKGHSSDLETQTPNANKLYCKPAPLEILTYSFDIKEEKMSKYSSGVCATSNKNDEAVSEDKNSNGQDFMHISQKFPDPSNSSLPEYSPQVTTYKSNPLSKQTPPSSCNLVPRLNIASGSDMPPSSPSSSVSSFSSDQFFNFVIFHAPKDQEMASRVCKDLEILGVERGTTFCEGFEIPGLSPLKCLENAVENSAYIILLLTKDFLETTWMDFQSTTAMMNSIQNAGKLGSVIPFYPKLNKLDGKIPVWIQNILPLDENSPLFKTKVCRTFQEDIIRNQYTLWKRRMLRNSTNLQQQNISIQWSMGDTTDALPLQTQPPHSVFHGQAPVIQISHATNVQIGNQNSMNVQFAPNGPQRYLDTNIFQDAEYENDQGNV